MIRFEQMQDTTEKDTLSTTHNETPQDYNVIVGAAQIVLSEKRTSLSLMRTGIAVCALPMAVFSALIATSKLYNTSEVLHLFIPVMVFNVALVGLGTYLIIRAARRIHHQDKLIRSIKKTHPLLAPYID